MEVTGLPHLARDSRADAAGAPQRLRGLAEPYRVVVRLRREVYGDGEG